MDGSSNTSFISEQSFIELRNNFRIDFDSAFSELYEIIRKIVVYKFNSPQQRLMHEDIIQSSALKILKRFDKFFYNCSSPGELYRYLYQTAYHISLDILSKEPLYNTVQSTDDEKFTEKPSDTENIEPATLGGTTKPIETLEIFQASMKILFSLNSKPYKILAFCFNNLVYGVESNHNVRGCSALTAKRIADKKLGFLRESFVLYCTKFYYVIEEQNLLPLDTKLSIIYKNIPYREHFVNEFYSQVQKNEKTIADWSSTIQKALVKELYSRGYTLDDK